jgi:hypothetical protein
MAKIYTEEELNNFSSLQELLITEDANLQNVFFLFITIWKGSILSTFGQRHLRLRIKRLQF